MSTTPITLQYPVEFSGEKYTVLNMRRCKVKDRRMATKQWSAPEDREVGLIANLCDVPPEVIHEVDAADYDRILKVLESFFAPTTAS